MLVLTFKPAVEDGRPILRIMSALTAGGTCRGHRAAINESTSANRSSTSGSFGLLGRDATGNIKPQNLGCTVNWDLVVFDEYHFGAWRDTARELFGGEDDAVAQGSQAGVRRRSGWRSTRRLTVLAGQKQKFLPITTQTYLYLSGTPLKGLGDGRSLKSRSSTGPHRRGGPGGGLYGRPPWSAPTLRGLAADAATDLSDARRTASGSQRRRVR